MGERSRLSSSPSPFEALMDGVQRVQLKGWRGTRWMWYPECMPMPNNLPDIRTAAGATSPDGCSGACLKLAGSSPSRDLLLGIRYPSDHSRRPGGGRRQLPLPSAPAPGWLSSARSRVLCPEVWPHHRGCCGRSLQHSTQEHSLDESDKSFNFGLASKDPAAKRVLYCRSFQSFCDLNLITT